MIFLQPPPPRPYDLRDVDWRVEVDAEKGGLKGTVVHTIRPLPGVKEVRFPCRRLAVDDVRIDDVSVPFFQEAEAVAVPIPPDRPELKISLRYQGRPQAGLRFVSATGAYPARTPMVYSRGGGDELRLWIPGYDQADDEATSTGTISVPVGWTAVSNGRLLGETRENGRSIWRWRQETPHPVTRIAFAAGPLVETLTGGAPRVSYLVPPGLEAAGDAAFGRTQRAVSYFERFLAIDYPWAKYAQVAVPDLAGPFVATSFAMIPADVLTPKALGWASDAPVRAAEPVVRQWFGAYATPEEPWIEEGFARLLPILWARESRGFEAYDLARLEVLQEGGPGAFLAGVMRTTGEAAFGRAAGRLVRESNGGAITATDFARAFPTAGPYMPGRATLRVVRTGKGYVVRQAAPFQTIATTVRADGKMLPVRVEGAETPLPVPATARLVELDPEAWLGANIAYEVGYKPADWRALFYNAANAAQRVRLTPAVAAGLGPAAFAELVATVRSPEQAARMVPFVPGGPTLLKISRRREPLLRRAAVMRLGEVGGPGAVDRLRELRDKEPDDLVKQAVYRSLGRLTRDPGWAEEAWQRDGFGDGYRVWSLGWWAENEPERARSEGLGALAAPISEPVRAAAVGALGVAKDEEGGRAVFEAIVRAAREPSVKVRGAAIAALAAYDSPDAIPLLEELEKSERAEVREAAAAALVSLRRPREPR